MVKIKIEVT